MSTENITQLINDCQSEDPKERIAAIEALSEREAMEATSVLMELLSSDPDKYVRSSIIYALNQLEAIEAIPLLIKHLSSDPEWDVRASAAFILRLLGENQLHSYPIGPALLNALNDAHKTVRNKAVVSLGFLQYLPAINRIRELLHTDELWFVRASAAEALGRMHDEESLTDLEQAISDPDPQVQRSAVVALGQFLAAPTVAPFVAQQLSKGELDPVVNAELLALSYRLGQLTHLEKLLVMLNQAEDYEVATEILMVLVDLTGEKPPADLQNRQEAIQAVLRQFLLRHPSLQSDVKRVQTNLNVLAASE